MEILVIDDQELVRMSVEKYLNDLGHDTFAVKNGLEGLRILEGYKPDLIILDINMPEMSGLEMLEQLRDSATPHTPIVIMSGNVADSVITQAFSLGVVDYIKKPATLAELGARVARIIGDPVIPAISRSENTPIVQEHGIGVVIPCNNEVQRINPYHFQKFLDQNLGYRICFVNYGSSDRTLQLLERLSKGYEHRVRIYNLKGKVGRAEAIRKGMLYTAANAQVDYVGYLNADLNANIVDFEALVQTLKSSKYIIASGSRIKKTENKISKELIVSAIDTTKNFLVRKFLGIPFKEIQCGAKVMPTEHVLPLFKNAFSSRHLFDAELFLRLRKIFGRKEALGLVCDFTFERENKRGNIEQAINNLFAITGQVFLLLKCYRLSRFAKQKNKKYLNAKNTDSKLKKNDIGAVNSAA